MLQEQLRQILDANPEYAAITPVIEKEILHHDIMDVLVKQGIMQSLTFIGGTSLRLCYNSSRLSEDLDFNAGHSFKPSDFDGLETDIQKYLQNKYETQVWVNKPSETSEGDTLSWKIIDVCAIPSFDIEKRALLNHYNIVVPTEGLLVPVQSLAETLADKFIALAYRSRHIKPRDLWDIIWIKQRGIAVSTELTHKKLVARNKTQHDFCDALQIQINDLLHNDEVRVDFNTELSRFIPAQIKARTIDEPDYWPYIQTEIKNMAEVFFNPKKNTDKFNMGS
jgi:predicted nucleotidyltransferase component of viral defense system